MCCGIPALAAMDTAIQQQAAYADATRRNYEAAVAASNGTRRVVERKTTIPKTPVLRLPAPEAPA